MTWLIRNPRNGVYDVGYYAPTNVREDDPSGRRIKVRSTMDWDWVTFETNLSKSNAMKLCSELNGGSIQIRKVS